MKKTLPFISTILFVGFILPEKRTIPVAGASAKDWHPKSFWFEPWGSSGVHKGIDIFANINTPLLLALLFTGGISPRVEMSWWY